MYSLFDLIVIIVVGFLGLSGLRKGLVEEAFKLIGIILASYIAVRYYTFGILLIQNMFTLSDGVLTVAGFMIVFLIVYLSIQLIAAALKRIIKSLSLVWLDRLTGLGFGAIKALVIMSIVVWCIGIFSETLLVNKLAASSSSYVYLEKSERYLSRALKIDEEADSLKETIRGIFRMGPKFPIPVPSLPDSSGNKIEFIDQIGSSVGETE
ncbi:MAG TPA: hypothetical protein DHW42_09780 [Candidatus Marinimicrobia bacterium]|nr:hypothetical protein [Candidatus Neomarinimicrobiota bacterium]